MHTRMWMITLLFLTCWPAESARTTTAAKARVSPERTAPERTAPERAAPERAAPERAVRRAITAAYSAMESAGAREDARAILRFFAPGFVSVDEDGEVSNRSELVEAFGEPNVWWRVRSISVHGREAEAIVSARGIAIVPGPDGSGAMPLGFDATFRHAWTRSASGWKIVSQVSLPDWPLTPAQIREATDKARGHLADSKRTRLVPVCTIPGGRWSHTARFSPTEPVFAVLDNDGGLCVVDAAGTALRTMRAPEETLTCLAWSPNGKCLLAGAGSGKVWLFDPESGEGRSVSEATSEATGAVQKVAWLGADRGVALRERPDGSYIASGSVFRISDGAETATFASSGGDYDRLATRQDGQGIAVLDMPEQARGAFLLDPGGTVRSTLVHPDFPSGPLSVTMAPDGNTVAVGYAPYHIILWDAREHKAIRRIPAHTNWVVALSFSPDGRMLISGAGDSTARIWSVPDGREIGRIRFPGSSNYVHSVGFSPDGKMVLAVAENGETVIAKAPRL